MLGTTQKQRSNRRSTRSLATAFEKGKILTDMLELQETQLRVLRSLPGICEQKHKMHASEQRG